MPTLRFNTTLAAGATANNLLAGSKFEYLPVPAAVTVYAVASVVAVDMECAAGNTVETDSLEIPVQTAANVGPNIQDHRVASFVGAPGDRLQVKLFDRGGAGAVVRTLIEIRPL